ncbi:MAG TPA: hypothetical protein VNA14_02970, partial [Mycobacteriales bacterium]|nr:hypothetical protein [Mycobacteriales bacterium]
ALVAFAIAVVIGHHLGTILKPLGHVGATEWADWVDLVVPLVLLGAAATALVVTGATPREWRVFAVGAVLYAQGHGIHLAANSVSNAGPVDRAKDASHLWDEVVGHYIWYAGLALVIAALFLAMNRAAVLTGPRTTGYLLALLVGFTWCTNAIEGGTVPLSAPVALGLVFVAAPRRTQPAARLVLAAFGLALLLLAVWGVWHQGFPQFSELGWI